MQVFDPPMLTTYHAIQEMRPMYQDIVAVINYDNRDVAEEESNVAVYCIFDQAIKEDCDVALHLWSTIPNACYMKTGTE